MSQVIKVGNEPTNHFQVTDEEAGAALRLFRETDHQDLKVLIGRVLDKPRTLAGALAAVQAEIPEVVKAEAVKNKDGSQRYTYADLSAVTRAILPLLGKHGLSWTTMPTMLGDKFVLEYRLMHASGDSLGGVYPLPVTGDPQATGSAITYARRYTLCSMTGVAPGDDDDAAEAQAAYRRGNERPAEPVRAPMSEFERSTGLHLLTPPTAEQREVAVPALAWAAFVQALEFRECLNERRAWTDPSDGPESPTWAERFAGRVAAEIAALSTPEQLKNVWNALKDRDLNMEHQGKPFSELLKEQAAAIQAAQADTANRLTADILASDYDTMGQLADRVLSARDQRRISEAQFSELHALHNERLEKLTRERNQAVKA